ncbi:MAG TPA: nuclear transport factor 2 family protein [Thermoanaerobaculia bacterium]|jgi:ketosteroid isomerase-like protein
MTAEPRSELTEGLRNLEVIRRYLQAIERGAPFEEIAEYFTPDVVQREFPNRLVPDGATRDLEQLRQAAARGKDVVVSQRYEVRSALAVGGRVAIEATWIGVLAVPFGSVPAGGALTAEFGVFFRLRSGRIVSQHNYDCFNPW